MTKPKRYVVNYIAYQHARVGYEEMGEGWQSFYTSEIVIDKQTALGRMDILKKDRFVKDVFLAEEIEVK